MKKILLSLLLFTLIYACSEQSPPTSPEAGSTANDVQQILANLNTVADPESSTYQTLQGKALDLQLFAGRKIFINYWASWCAPCIEEIPSINRAAQILSEEDYVFLFASDENIETISLFLDERGFAGNFIKLNPFFGSYGINAVPSSILVDESGEIIKSWLGAFEWDSPEMIAEIRSASE